MDSGLLLGELLLGLLNGAFYALLSLGLALIFGMLRILNLAHGALYMLGAVATWLLLDWLGIGYWGALFLSPLIIGLIGAVIERTLLQWIYREDHLYSLLLTLGLALALESATRNAFGSSGLPYDVPAALSGVVDLGFMYLPIYRVWAVLVSAVVCLCTWLVVEKTRLGSVLRAATENPMLVQTFGINVPRLITLTYAASAALAALAGVLAAPIYQISPEMGSELIIVVFAIVVIGGMGSMGGSIAISFLLGIAEAVVKLVYPELSNLVVFILMGIVLVFRPSGLFGKEA
jgi:branched-chain amino acid transport system permease protein